MLVIQTFPQLVLRHCQPLLQDRDRLEQRDPGIQSDVFSIHAINYVQTADLRNTPPDHLSIVCWYILQLRLHQNLLPHCCFFFQMKHGLDSNPCTFPITKKNYQCDFIDTAHKVATATITHKATGRVSGLGSTGI